MIEIRCLFCQAELTADERCTCANAQASRAMWRRYQNDPDERCDDCGRRGAHALDCSHVQIYED